MKKSFWKLLEEHRVVIPIIQRDYAQGRTSGKVPLIRQRFLNALKAALAPESSPIELDFIYGYEKSNGGRPDFIPLDGQQRLTTLFLLHWYAAAREGHLLEADENLKNFTYQTRHSSSVFCAKLAIFQPEEFTSPLSATLKNEPWFLASWLNDPTICSMLVMLDDIQSGFCEIARLWHLLTSENPRILFHILPMGKLGLPDDLYIKMNSRGKELTEFEHFKSRFSSLLCQEDADIFNRKIDQAWSDLFWNLFKQSKEKDIACQVDEGFMRVIRYLTDMLNLLSGQTSPSEEDDFKKYQEAYRDRQNVKFLFDCLDALYANVITGFFEVIFYAGENGSSNNNIRLFFQSPDANLLRKCAASYRDAPSRINPFSMGEQLLLYGCLIHLTDNQSGNDRRTFAIRMRQLRNLIANSEDRIRRENMGELLRSAGKLVSDGLSGEESKFDPRQVKEELDKQTYILENPKMRDAVYSAEDHRLLQGCTAVFDLDEKLEACVMVFGHLFKPGCNYDEIHLALLSLGDYGQAYTWSKRYGNDKEFIWRELLTPSGRRHGFQNTKRILDELLSHLMANPDASAGIVLENRLKALKAAPCSRLLWRDYMVLYRHRWSEQGFLTWKNYIGEYTTDYSHCQFSLIMMRKTTLGGFHWNWFLYALHKEAREDLLNFDSNYGGLLVFAFHSAILRISCLNNGYKLTAGTGCESVMEKLKKVGLVDQQGVFNITQDEQGFDTEDRIQRGIYLISQLKSMAESGRFSTEIM